MNTGQPPGEGVADLKEMPEIGAGMILAKSAIAELVDRFLIVSIFSFARVKKVKKFSWVSFVDIDFVRIFCPDIKALVAGIASGNNAVKNMIA